MGHQDIWFVVVCILFKIVNIRNRKKYWQIILLSFFSYLVRRRRCRPTRRFSIGRPPFSTRLPLLSLYFASLVPMLLLLYFFVSFSSLADSVFCSFYCCCLFRALRRFVWREIVRRRVVWLRRMNQRWRRRLCDLVASFRFFFFTRRHHSLSRLDSLAYVRLYANGQRAVFHGTPYI